MPARLSIGLDIGGANHRSQFLYLVSNEFAKIARRENKRLGAHRGQFLLDLRLRKRRINVGVELRDDILRCILRRDEAAPDVDIGGSPALSARAR